MSLYCLEIEVEGAQGDRPESGDLDLVRTNRGWSWMFIVQSLCLYSLALFQMQVFWEALVIILGPWRSHGMPPVTSAAGWVTDGSAAFSWSGKVPSYCAVSWNVSRCRSRRRLSLARGGGGLKGAAAPQFRPPIPPPSAGSFCFAFFVA